LKIGGGNFLQRSDHARREWGGVGVGESSYKRTSKKDPSGKETTKGGQKGPVLPSLCQESAREGIKGASFYVKGGGDQQGDR